MNKLTKGAIAGAAGIALLLGGAGSFALWNSNADVTGGAITAGTMTLSADSADATWQNLTTGHAGSISPASFKIVPGDTIQLDQPLTISATGDDLSASISSNAASVAASLGSGLAAPTVTQTFTTDAGTVINPATFKVTSATTSLHAKITIAWPFGSAPGSATTGDNADQGGSGTLKDVTVTLTQLDPSSN